WLLLLCCFLCGLLCRGLLCCLFRCFLCRSLLGCCLLCCFLYCQVRTSFSRFFTAGALLLTSHGLFRGLTAATSALTAGLSGRLLCGLFGRGLLCCLFRCFLCWSLLDFCLRRRLFRRSFLCGDCRWRRTYFFGCKACFFNFGFVFIEIFDVVIIRRNR